MIPLLRQAFLVLVATAAIAIVVVGIAMTADAKRPAQATAETPASVLHR